VARRIRIGRDGWRLLAPHLAFDSRQYRRVRLWRDEHWEALVLCWLPGQHTQIHDHGGSTGVAYTLSGTLHESRYRWPGPGASLESHSCGDQAAGAHGLELADTIHEVSNETPFPAASLHLYSPPLTALGAYHLTGGQRREVDVTDRPEVVVGGDPTLPA
jgi:predicted metal-dependent enzyme (double-stranded beta helix superfamily)